MNRRQLLVFGGMAMTLSACGDSGLNPFGWFQRAPEVETLDEITFVREQDTRPLIDTISALSIERRPGGALIRATGVPPTQGWHSASLVLVDEDSDLTGTLSYTFRALPPESAQPVSRQQSREISVAVFVSDFTLERVREIRVAGARNIRTIRR